MSATSIAREALVRAISDLSQGGDGESVVLALEDWLRAREKPKPNPDSPYDAGRMRGRP